MTFEEFVKTRVFRLDLGDAIQDVALDGRSGYVYADKLWIETPILLDKEDPKHRVLLEREEFESTRLQILNTSSTYTRSMPDSSILAPGSRIRNFPSKTGNTR